MCLMFCTLDSKASCQPLLDLILICLLVLFMVLVLHWVTAVDTNRPKLPSRFDPANSRSVFQYEKGLVPDVTSNATAHDYEGHNGGLRAANTIAQPCAMYRADDFRDGGNTTINPLDRIHSSASTDIERQDIALAAISVSKIRDFRCSQTEDDQCSRCDSGTRHRNSGADDRIASTDQIVLTHP